MSDTLQNITERISSLTIGQVESVSPNKIEVLLDLLAPQSTALNTGSPLGFPRINSYLLIPNEIGAVVGLIIWIGIERSPYPKRPGLAKDFGLVDLPFPLRKLTLTPLGTLIAEKKKDSDNIFRLQRGVTVFPSVGDTVLLPTENQLRAILQAAESKDQRLSIGLSPLTGSAEITVDPDKLFGRHLAVLGNTGSGKSCSVAGLIRWSLETAKSEIKDNQKPVNARFIVLDPNGEYADAFKDLDARIFRVSPKTGEESLKVPAWMWNSHEWASFSRAGLGVQRPLLCRAIREMRSGRILDEPLPSRIKRVFGTTLYSCTKILAGGAPAYRDFPGNKNFGLLLRRIGEDAEVYAGEVTDVPMKDRLVHIKDTLTEIAQRRYTYNDRQGQPNSGPFSEQDVRQSIDVLNNLIDSVGGIGGDLSINEDAPIIFDVEQLPEHIEQIGHQEGNFQYLDSLILRIRMMLADGRLGPVVKKEGELTFETWLKKTIGSDGAINGPLAILDLSLIPSDVIHTIIAVIARIIFEATQRYKKLKGQALPTVLVLEEAHTFIRRGGEYDNEDIASPAQMCRFTFERIAREGRKFGLGLVLSSQRPSELSPTVLAQCNTFLLHRIVNDRDQELVGKLVPDNLGGLLKELPSLPSRRAILLGWTSPIPTLVDIHELPEEQRPRSEDPDFWDVWTGEKPRPVNWKEIADDWIK